MIKFSGVADAAARFLQKNHLTSVSLWGKFISVFREQKDGENGGWRGEYFGKMMRGAVTVYEYTRDDTLYKVLEDAARNILTVREKSGRVSSYTYDTEFTYWDVWCRKYVLLGCEYFLTICKDETLKKEIIAFCMDCADAILKNIGEGKKDITETSFYWYGVNSSSVLEAIVNLYRFTGEKRYLEFAHYIVKRGGATGINVFRLAYENRLSPYEYGIPKAYELTSCFEGLLAYYEITGEEWCKAAVLNYANAILDTEISIVGGSGTTHELFDHTKAHETSDKECLKQETCVTVTLMKFFSRILTLTGDSKYADVIEKSFYNAYLGALNEENRYPVLNSTLTENCTVKKTVLPFDSYSPLTSSKRGRAVGGFQLLSDGSYYGCCACIGAVGVGVFLKYAVVANDDTVLINFYEKGKCLLQINGVSVSLLIDTDYPVSGDVSVRVKADIPIKFKLKLRVPEWSDGLGGYKEYERVWEEDTINLSLNTSITIHRPKILNVDTVYTKTAVSAEKKFVVLPQEIYGKEDEEKFIAITRGPLVLAADSRTGKHASSVFCIPESSRVCKPEIVKDVPCLLKMQFDGKEGSFNLVDYASAGKDWNTDIAAWLKVKM